LKRFPRYCCVAALVMLHGGTVFAAPPPQSDATSHYIQTHIRQAGESSFHLSGAHDNFERVLLSAGAERLYAANGYQPIWVNPHKFEQLLQALAATADDGLIPQNYALDPLQRVAVGGNGSETPEALACRDVLATRAYLLALGHLSQGQIDLEAVEPLWQSETMTQSHSSGRNAEAVIRLAETGLSSPPDDVFARARPTLPLYDDLRKAHARLRQYSGDASKPNIPAGPSLRPGDRDERVPLLRQRFALPAGADSLVYDAAVVDAVQEFQRSHRLAADGIVGRATLAGLNASAKGRLDQLRVNLERARRLSREWEAHMVLVDIAGAQVFYLQNGEAVWHSRAQVGTPARATPQMASQITHFTFNPPWTVPPTIMRKDKLPRIRSDPGYLKRHRYRVFDANGRERSPGSVDWSRPAGITLRQDPGPGNALGRIAIRFPNDKAIYLHDTPSKRLFERGQRTFSSGCVRVEKALDLANLLIRDAGDLDEKGVQRILDRGRTGNVPLIHPVPVLLAYWTADVGDDGNIRYRPDIYDYDARLLAALPKPGASWLTASACLIDRRQS